jgi:putative endonuclease
MRDRTSKMNNTMFYVYILQSLKDNRYYIGQTKNLKLRLEKHYKGYVKSTKYRRPLKLIYYEKFKIRKDAYKREYFLKRMKGDIQFKEIIRKCKRD